MYQPQPGDIGLTQIHGAAGLGIRIGQWANGTGFADFEHALQVTSPNEIIEAEPGGAILSPLDKYDPETIVWLRCPEQLRESVAAEARALIRTPYSFLDYDALALHRLHIPAPRLQLYISDTGHMICSQLVDEAARRGGWKLFDDGRWPGYVTPGHIWQLIKLQDRATAPPPVPHRPIIPRTTT